MVFISVTFLLFTSGMSFAACQLSCSESHLWNEGFLSFQIVHVDHLRPSSPRLRSSDRHQWCRQGWTCCLPPVCKAQNIFSTIRRVGSHNSRSRKNLVLKKEDEILTTAEAASSRGAARREWADQVPAVMLYPMQSSLRFYICFKLIIFLIVF